MTTPAQAAPPSQAPLGRSLAVLTAVALALRVAYLLLDGVGMTLQTIVGMVVLAFYHPALLGFNLFLLVALATVMDASGTGPQEKRRPTRVKVAAGAGAIAFEGVIESIDTRYTEFLADGTPVRATCAVKLQEASRATFVKH